MVPVQEAGYPDINIICEKVAAEGETRFEDRYRLPIGISVNMTSFSAKLLTSSVYNPRNILVFAQMGDGNELEVQSAAAFAAPGEALTYLQLQASFSPELIRLRLVANRTCPKNNTFISTAYL